jgi:drug/metabolite transporter (DMT)-like permease
LTAFPPRTARPLAVGLALLAVYTLWGSTYLGIRFAEETMPALLMGFLRFIVAGGLMLAWGVLRQARGERMPTRAQWGAATITGAALLFAGNGGVIWAEQHIPSGVAAIVVALVPLHMAWLDRVFYGQPVSRWTALGIAAGFVGLVVLVQPSSGSHIDLGGVAVVLVGSFCWAAGSLYARNAPLPRSVATSTGIQMLAGGVLLGVVGLLAGEGRSLHLQSVSVKSWLAVGYLIIAGSLIGFSAYAWLIRNARTSLVSTYAYVNPVVAVLLGAAFASEPITARTLIAGAIILAGVAMIVARPAPRRVATAPAEPPAPAAVSAHERAIHFERTT